MRTMSRLEHSESVIMALENLARVHIALRRIMVERVPWDGMTMGVTSWMVQTMGTPLKGMLLAVGAKIRSAWARRAARPRPAMRQRASFASNASGRTSKCVCGAMAEESLATASALSAGGKEET